MPRRPSAIVRSVAPFAAALAASLWACASPTLPLPPPEAPTQVTVDAEHIKLTAGCGGAEGGAYIIIVNQTAQLVTPSEAGVVSLASDCGSWDATLFAHTGDTLAISQESGTQVSDSTIYTVR